jgi:hypothetical protein
MSLDAKKFRNRMAKASTQVFPSDFTHKEFPKYKHFSFANN